MMQGDRQSTIDQIYEVDDVFTPTSPADKNFVEREEISENFVDALKTRGSQIIIYGHGGAGKTSLAENKIRQIYERHIEVTCTEDTSFDDLILDAFDRLNKYYTDESIISNTTKVTASLKADFMALKSKIGADKTYLDQNKIKRILPPQLTFNRLGHFLGSANMCWLIDDFHLLEKSVQRQISQVMKVYSNLSSTYNSLKIVTVGIFDSGHLIVEYNPNMRDRVAEINVPLLSDKEIEEIIDNGQKLLNFSIPDHIKHYIVKFSNGVPNVCHKICLNTCIAVGISETQVKEVTIEQGDVNDAFKLIMSQSSATLKADFDKACRVRKKSKYSHYKLILKALTQFGLEGAEPSDILFKIKEGIAEYPPGNFSKYLKSLTMDDRGSILRYNEIKNHYFFNNPFYHTIAQGLNKMNKFDDLQENDINFQEIIESKKTALQSLRKKLMSENYI